MQRFILLYAQVLKSKYEDGSHYFFDDAFVGL